MSHISKATRVFGYTDIHWASRDPLAMAVADAARRRFKPHITVIGGDLLDATPFARHPAHDLDETTRIDDWKAEELDPTNKWLDEVQRDTTQQTVWVMGNHDAWFSRWAANSGRGGKAAASVLLPEKYLVKDRGRKNFTTIPYCQTGLTLPYYQLHPKLCVVHGWTTCKNAARKHLEMSRNTSIIYHHTHRMEMVAGRNPFTKQYIVSFNAGCLCKLQPLYAHGSPTDWTHGFWVAYMSKRRGGSFTAYPVNISSGTAVLPCGTELKAA